MQNFLYNLSRGLLRIYAALMLKFDIYRQFQLPSGPKIFVANHPSALDPFLIHLLSKEKLSVLITEKAFQVPLFGSFLHRVGEISVPLEKGSTALEQANDTLKNGRSVAIFIEGRTSPSQGGFLPPRTGAARLALSSRLPVIPVGISLRRERCLNIRSSISGAPAEGQWYFFGPYAITVGQPLLFDGNIEDREHVRRISEVVMEKIRLLAHESERRMRGLSMSAA